MGISAHHSAAATASAQRCGKAGPGSEPCLWRVSWEGLCRSAICWALPSLADTLAAHIEAGKHWNLSQPLRRLAPVACEPAHPRSNFSRWGLFFGSIGLACQPSCSRTCSFNRYSCACRGWSGCFSKVRGRRSADSCGWDPAPTYWQVPDVTCSPRCPCLSLASAERYWYEGRRWSCTPHSSCLASAPRVCFGQGCREAGLPECLQHNWSHCGFARSPDSISSLSSLGSKYPQVWPRAAFVLCWSTTGWPAWLRLSSLCSGSSTRTP